MSDSMISNDTNSSRQPNVLLLVLDSVRAQNTSLHGYHRETTPFLEAFADDAVVYDRAYAPGTESLSSHTSIFTGLHVREHGLTDRHSRLASGHTIWEQLSGEGYDTGVFSNNPFLTELPVGLQNAFETVVERQQELPYPGAVNPKNFVIDADDGPGKYVQFLRASTAGGSLLGSLVNGLAFKLKDTPREQHLPPAWQIDGSASVYADAFLDWEAERDGPWAACVNFMDAHFPYQPGDDDRWGSEELTRLQSEIQHSADQAWSYVAGERPWEERASLEALYDGAIRRMDREVERTIEALSDRGTLDETLVLVTADHGEGFGERSPVRPELRVVGHGNGGVEGPLVHVPLVVRSPADVPAAADRVSRPATLTRFPGAVDAVREGGSVVDALTEGPIVASTTSIDPGTAAAAREQGVDPTPYQEPADALYRVVETVDGKDTVFKQSRWGDATHCRVLDGGDEFAPPEASDDPQLDAVIEELREADVRELSGQSTQVDEATKQRLDDLGYA